MPYNFYESIKNKYKISQSEYRSVHRWLIINFGNATKCENSGCEKISIRFTWAKLKDKKYEKKRENFIQLCGSCHVKQDKTREGIKSAIKKLQARYNIYENKKRNRQYGRKETLGENF